MTPVRLCVGSGIKVQRQIAEFLLPIIAEAVNFDPGILLCELSGFICRLFFWVLAIDKQCQKANKEGISPRVQIFSSAVFFFLFLSLYEECLFDFRVYVVWAAKSWPPIPSSDQHEQAMTQVPNTDQGSMSNDVQPRQEMKAVVLREVLWEAVDASSWLCKARRKLGNLHLTDKWYGTSQLTRWNLNALETMSSGSYWVPTITVYL